MGLIGDRLISDLWHLRAAALLAAHVVIAGGVSVHVLLTKRDVGASVGWIGLGWLSPFLGGALYYLFGINRVRRRALRDRPARRRETDGAIENAAESGPLERAAHQISRRPALPGNTINMLHNGDEAYPRMLAAIGAARETIALCSYIFRDDAAGAPFVDALIAAHRRGVAVRVLVDGIGGGYFVSPAFARLRRGGVPAARFMHSAWPWRMAFLNLRTHKKLLVVDGRDAFAGGLNIGAENLLASRPPHPVRDTHFAVAGPVVAQLMATFAEDWLFATGEALDGDAWYPSLAPSGPSVARVVTSGPDREIERIESLALIAIACAGRSIQVMTPYFLPDERIVSALALAALRGIAVDVVIPARSNQPLVDMATRANLGPLLHAGCHIWRGKPPFEHSKLMVVDREWSLIGSANWDMRSFRLNFELDLAVADPALADTLAEHIEARRHDRITGADLAARSRPARVRDAAVRLLLPYL